VATVEHADRTLGSAATTELLYRRHGSRVLRYCLRCLRRPADAEDALQQTFLQAHRALGRGVEPVAEATWLLTIARNVCLTRVDALRRRGRVEFAEDPGVLAEIAGVDDAGAELSAEIVEALARLPERQRLVLFLREWQELSYAEIAVALETTESAVETLLFRARKALAVQLGMKRRRRGLDLAALLGWGRSWSGVAVPNVATGVAAVVAVAATGLASGSAPVQASLVPVPAAAAATPAVVHARAVLPARAPLGAHEQAASTVRHVRSLPSVDAVSPVVATAAAPASGPGSAPATPRSSGLERSATDAAVASVPAAVIPSPPLGPVVAHVATPVTAIMDATVPSAAAAAVPAAAATVGQAAQDAAATTQAATETVSTAVARLLPGH
jgi:RNA polymerase sigma-70 factor, ECF subfamily